jgi:S-DNA-T family DNA segregation ATPase FtsK/SpoIIIE
MRDLGFTPQTPEEPIPEEKPEKETPPINREYFRPPLDLLETYTQPINTVQENHAERMEIIQRTLEEFHINAVPQSYIQGPSVTRYEIMMPAGISVRKVLNYDDDLKMRLAAKDGVRIEAPIPGKNLVGIEVANSVKVTVGLKEVMEGLAGKKSKPTALMFAVGKDIVGNSISYDLAKGPHYLIAGATGSGKSVALHVMIVSLLMRYSPEELKLVLVDPKSVEFRKYEHIPHLLVDEIVTEPKRALTLLQWAYDETNRRNEMFTACGGMISNIDDYNTQIASDTIPKLPRIVFVIDELADLMEACKKDLEQRIRMIAAKSRSAGIHLVLATQRPSVDVITGTIKANLPSRIALKVMNFADSQTILGEAGAEKLLGNGDMLYKDSSMGDYERYQGAYISGREVTNIVNYIKDNNKAYFDDDVKDFLEKETSPKQEESVSIGGASDENNGPEMNDLMLKALWLGVNTQSMSIALLQRRFQIGYARAGGLVDKLERMGYVSGNEGSKARRVLMTKEEFISKFGPIEDD